MVLKPIICEYCFWGSGAKCWAVEWSGVYGYPLDYYNYWSTCCNKNPTSTLGYSVNYLN